MVIIRLNLLKMLIVLVLSILSTSADGDRTPPANIINVLSYAGESVNLQCRNPDNSSHIRWTYHGPTFGKSINISIAPGSEGHYTLSSSPDGWLNLTLKPFSIAIAGLYVCSDRRYNVQLSLATGGETVQDAGIIIVPIVVIVFILGGCFMAIFIKTLRRSRFGRALAACCRSLQNTGSTWRCRRESSQNARYGAGEADREIRPCRRVRWASEDTEIPSKPLLSFKKIKEKQQLMQDEDLTDSDDDIVNPWTVHAKSSKGCDLNRLVQRFGAKHVDVLLIERIEQITQRRAHHLLRRRHFFSHREFEMILHCHETRRPFYLYTGRGPSTSAMHIGHLIPFIFAKWLQDTFEVPLVIQMTDDEKFLWKDLSLEETRRMTYENAKDIIAVGFDVNKTFIFADTDFVSAEYYKNVCRIWKCVPLNRVKKIFGMSDTSETGKIAFPAIQAAPAFSSSFPLIFNGKSDVPCLIPCAMDQDPFFRLTRDVAPKLGYRKPAIVHSSFVPSLHGAQFKMSSSVPSSCIYLNDTEDEIREKVMTRAFSGGQATAADHHTYGGDCDIDVSFKILSFFLDDDDRLEELKTLYKRGDLLSSEMKEEFVSVIAKIIAEHQNRRHHVTDQLVELFMKPRKLNYDL